MAPECLGRFARTAPRRLDVELAAALGIWVRYANNQGRHLLAWVSKAMNAMPAATSPSAPPRNPPRLLSTSLFQPRIWLGMSFRDWLGLLTINRWQIDWKRVPVALAIIGYTVPLSLLAVLARALLAGEINRTRIDKPPVFILGHWRSGTTLLHELLVLDERHAYPTTYTCIMPRLFMHTEWIAQRLFGFLVAGRRPMDNMTAGFNKPQEDEFALCNLGVDSPYRSLAFPNRPPLCQEYLSPGGLSPRQNEKWKQALERFLRMVTCRAKGKRLVLKSPTHTARIKTLLELFPDARFVHIVRDPHVVFPSTVHLWKTLYREHGMQVPNFAGLEEQVFETFARMYEKFENERSLIPADRFCEVRYEDLVRDTVGEMRTIYDHLGLGGFEQALPRLREYLAANDGYQTNQYELSDDQRRQISSRWRKFIAQYGY